uniref:Phosphatidylinositol 4,5-bisphosphate 5-phosphatase A n=1 Tax=Oryzias sinensis TaxID=183150 RepID=A0A8C7Z4V8_9TELE
METDQNNPSQSQTPEDDTKSGTEALSVPSNNPNADSKSGQHTVPHRPRRPQRSPRVESSVDISEPKPEPVPPADEESLPDGIAASRPKPSSPAPVKPIGESPAPSTKSGPKGPGHHPVRAASVPQPPASRSVIHIITWNVGSAEPPDDITALLGLNVGDGNTDMYIIGLQEVNSMINKRLKDALFTDQWSELCMERLSPFGYVLVSDRMQGLLLLVFAKYFHLPFLRGVQTETTRTGLGGYWGNKGGVGARMSVFGHTICFVNCHLPAHMENSDQRMEDFESILQQQQFEGQAASGVLDHDVVFWFGDLNFRINDLDIQAVKSAIDNNKFSALLEKDQLNMAKDSETVLEGFHEGPLKFPPTYKFDVGTNTYDTSGKKRKPAWTDRILWRLRATAPAAQSSEKRGSFSGLTSGTKVTQHSYQSHMEYTISDHKPVSSIFTLQFPYKLDIPLVTIIVEDEWNSVADAKVIFKMAPKYSRSSWDWIGLYKVGFKHPKDYVGYVWAKQEEADFLRQEHEVTFIEEELPKGSGDYILGYYSNNMNTIVGVTEPFQIQLPSSEHESSSSDSSDFSSEDDSTVVMKMRSRSSSPRKVKRRTHRGGSRSASHSRSRSGSPAKLTELEITDGAAAESESRKNPEEGSTSQQIVSAETNKNKVDSGV